MLVNITKNRLKLLAMIPVAILFLLVFLGGNAHAQGETSKLTGKVWTPSMYGAFMTETYSQPVYYGGATVNLVDENSNSYQATTSSDGMYSIDVPKGIYHLASVSYIGTEPNYGAIQDFTIDNFIDATIDLTATDLVKDFSIPLRFYLTVDVPNGMYNQEVRLRRTVMIDNNARFTERSHGKLNAFGKVSIPAFYYASPGPFVYYITDPQQKAKYFIVPGDVVTTFSSGQEAANDSSVLIGTSPNPTVGIAIDSVAYPTTISLTRGPSPTNEPPVISWNPIDGAYQYKIYRGSGFVSGGFVTDSTQPTFIDSTLTSDGPHMYNVAAVDENGYVIARTDINTYANIYYDHTAPTINSLSISSTTKAADETIYAYASYSDSQFMDEMFLSAPFPTNNSKVEYYIDNDPGFGNGIQGSVSAAFINSNPRMGLSGLLGVVAIGPDTPTGTHTVYVRVRDAAGNWSSSASVEILVLPDSTPPTIESILINPLEVNAGQNGIINVVATDGSGVTAGEYFIDTDPGVGSGTALNASGGVNATLSGQVGAGLSLGVHTLYVRVSDAAGNWSQIGSIQFTIVDAEAPVVTGVGVSTGGQKAVGDTATLAVTATDNVGVVGGEYFVDVDPGQGSGTALSLVNGGLVGIIGADLAVGVHTIYVRVYDETGNWSGVLPTTIVVYDPAVTTVVTGNGNNAITPTYSETGGDVLPGVIDDPAQKDKASFDLSVQYTNGAIATGSSATFSYATGKKCSSPNPENCHEMTLAATQIDWMIIGGTNDSVATITGTATVAVDGVTTTNTFVLEVTDGAKLGGTADIYTLKVYAPGADPATSDPLYYVSEPLTKNGITIS